MIRACAGIRLSTLVRTGCAFTAALAVALPVRAQVEQPPRAVHGLFGGPPRDPNTTRTFDFNLSLFDAYDDDVLAGAAGGGATPGPALGGNYSGLTGGLAFSRTGRHIDFGLTAGTNYRYYPTGGNMLGVADQGGVSLGVHGKHTTLQTSGSVGYQPFFAFAPFAPPIANDTATLQPAPVDAVLTKRTALSYGTNVSLEHDLGARTVVTGVYSIQQLTYSGENADQREQGAGLTLSHHLTKALSLRLGYQYQETQFDAAVATPLTRVHNVDAGVDYSKALGATRRTTIGFTSGSAMVDTAGAQSYRVIGDAWLNREIGETWAARANYHRGVTTLDGFTQPAFTDAVTLSVGGQITHRLDLQTSAAYSRGDLNPAAATNRFDTYTGSARLRVAFTRTVAVYGEYVVYQYNFDNASDLPFGVSRHMFREGIRGGLTLWVPLFR
jgi:predicted porin